MAWRYIASLNRYRNNFNGRVFDIEPGITGRWSLWYRRPTAPYRSLLVGRFNTVYAAMEAASDIVERLKWSPHMSSQVCLHFRSIK